MTAAEDTIPFFIREPVGDWANDAACASPNVDPEWWFSPRAHEAERALAICADCPVQQECLEHALRNHENHGIWGGKSERSRQRMAAAMRRRSA